MEEEYSWFEEMADEVWALMLSNPEFVEQFNLGVEAAELERDLDPEFDYTYGDM